MSDQRSNQKLALEGGLKAVASLAGRGQPKIGVEEFMSVAERFGLSPRALARIRKIAAAEDWDTGPFLANYYSGLKESKVQAYEAAARKLFGSKYAIAVSSGTGALHSAFVAAGVGPGTEVICPAIGFFATAAAVVMARGVPVFSDVDDSLAMDPKKIAAKVTPRTVAIAPTCIMGNVPDMDGVMAAAREHKLRVVEDCAQSCGGQFHGRYVGTFGDLGCFSISAYKIIGGGEGGLVLTNDERLWERASNLVECGGLWRPNRFAPPRYDGELFCGTNYRMSEVEAAIDVVQIGKVAATARRFRTVKKRIIKQLRTFREIVPQRLNDVDGEVGYNLRFFPETVELSEKIVRALIAEGIGAGTRGQHAGPDWHIYSYMYPVLLKCGPTPDNCPFDCPRYRERGGAVTYARGDCPVADDLYDRLVTVPLNQWYTAEDCRQIAAGINKVLSAYCTPDAEARSWVPS